MSEPDRPERRLQWLQALREHLNDRVVPVAAAHGVKSSSHSLQDAVVVALTTPTRTNIRSSTSSPARPAALPLENEVWTVGRLQETKKSFHSCLRSVRAESVEDELVECPVILIAMLTSSSKDVGLVIKDRTGEISCEVILPAESIHGNYLEIEVLTYLSQSCTLTSESSPQPARLAPLSVAHVQRHLNRGETKSLRGVTVTGRLDGVSEPMKNGPESMVILRLTHTADDSVQCHIITQSQELLHLPRVMKLFSDYIFTGLKSVIMNKGKGDEMVVLTTTAHSEVEYVPANQEPRLLNSPSRTASTTQRREDSDTVSPLRKKLRAEEEGRSTQACVEETTSEEYTANPCLTVPRNNNLLSYKGVITRCLLPEAGVYELDKRLALYLTHSNLSNQGRGLREGSEIEIINAHLLKISTPPYKQLSGFLCCSVSRVEVVHFSEKNAPFKAFIPQNKLAHTLSKFAAMDVAWLTVVFLSLLKKFKKKEAFIVMTELCAMVGVRTIHQNPHTSFLGVPHNCLLLEPVDLSHRPLFPSLQHVLQSSEEQVASPLFCWRGSKEGGGAGAFSSLTGATCVLSVAVRATWSFGVIKSSDYPHPQVLIGTMCGNRTSAYLELSDRTASVPLLPSVPYHSTDRPRDSTNHWLLQAKLGCRVALKDFWVVVEKTEESEGTKSAKLKFYLHSCNIEVLTQEKTHSEHRLFQVSSNRGSGAILPSALYVYIKSKNCFRVQGHGGEKSEHGFEAQALVHSSLEVLEELGSETAARETQSPPVAIAVGFHTARCYSYIHIGCIYRMSCLEGSTEALPSLDKLTKEPYIAVSEGVLLEMVALPCVPRPGTAANHLEIGELVSMFYLPKLPTVFATKENPSPRSKEGLVSFRGLVKEHSYRIDCATSLRQSAIPLQDLGSHTTRHIVALCVRGVQCPNTIMVYCKYMPHEPLPLGLLPGSIASFHFFSLKSSTRSGNMYCVNGSSSSITVEAIGEESTAKFDSRNKSHDFTQEMTCLAVTHIYDLTQRLLQGCLSREVVCVRGTVMAVLHAFIQFQCQACLCTMVDGLCRTACPAKRATLNTDARFLIQDGTGEAHLYVKDRVLPIVLGMTEQEWSDLLDLIYKVGQVTYTKSSMFKGERSSRAVTINEKAEGMFLGVLTRPSLVRSATIYCQPFLSSTELQHPLGQRSYRVCLRHSIDYVTLSQPRLQLRALALAPTDPLTHSHKLLAKLEPPEQQTHTLV